MAKRKDTLHDLFGPHPACIRLIVAAIDAGDIKEAMRQAGHQDLRWAHGAWRALHEGRAADARAELLALLPAFPEETSLKPCGFCGAETPPRRFAYDATGLLDDPDDHEDDPDHVPLPEVGVDLTCMACGAGTGTHTKTTLREAVEAARDGWNHPA